MDRRPFSPGPLRILVTLFSPALLFLLVFSSAAADFSMHDWEYFTAGLRAEDTPLAQFEPQTVNPLVEEKEPPVSERYPWLFPAAVAAAAIALAFLLLGVIRRARKVLPPPSPKVKLVEERKREEVTVVSPPLRKEPIVEGIWKNYELIDTSPYAIGGFADIFRARDKRSGEMVAVKMPRIAKGKTLDKRVFDEFLGEAEKWSRLKHKNIV